ncbi:VirB4-like conjugal transfer ATPase, CD1110 family [Fusicatenibacter saccharivorans]|uniref:VirB4-like conjugal transfer ATPase, CD1110 family n=1 Tax=Lachnospiraceae TaxID=186803 RepID=UPI003F8A0097
MRKRKKKPGKREIRSASTGNPAAKSRSQPAGNVGLTKEEKKRLRQLREKKAEQKKKKIPFTAQETLPYKEIYRDGICQTEDKFFSKTIQFFDINYQLAKNDDKTTIFENYCEFLNYFDSSVRFQITFLNQQVNFDEYSKTIDIPPKGDAFDDIRKEYADMLKMQLAKGNNGLVKTKYITFGIKADSLRAAKSRLERIETGILNNFKVLGAAARPLNGLERLKILHDTMNMDTKEPFKFHYGMVAKTGLGTKDFIAPTGFDFRNDSYFRMGQTFGCVSYLQITSPELTDKMLADFLDMEENLIVNIHVQPVDPKAAIKSLKNILSNIQKMKIEEQKKAVRSGYDMDIIPTDISTYGEEAENLLNELQSRNEKMFKVTFLLMNTADSKRKLDNIAYQTAGIAQKYNCNIRRLQYLQEQGMVASLPLGMNQTGVHRLLTTTSTAIFVPFTTQELFMDGEALYYGLNALSNNMIMVDRKKLKNPNGLILGTPGSGKSFAAKREILNVFLITDDDIIVCDPEGEYFPLVNALNGQVVKISAKSTDYINPMDVNLDVIYHPEKYRINGDTEDVDTIIADKSEFIASFCELIMKKPQGAELDGDEVSIIDHCIKDIYEEFLYNDPVPEKMPVLEDFLNRLNDYADQNDAARRIANCLQLYVTGSQNVFNHRTNVDMNNRVVCFDIKDLGTTLRKAGMLIVQNMVWTRVSTNRALKKATRYYVDEFHLLLKQPQTANYSVEIWKRFRKWGGIPTGLTQNVSDFLGSLAVENIVGNSDFIYMLNQHSGDQKILAEKLNISQHQLSFVNNSNAGEGLIFYGNVIIPFSDKYPTDTKTYAIMSTKPEEMQTEG